MSPLEKQLRAGEYGPTYGPTRIEVEAADRIAELESENRDLQQQLRSAPWNQEPDVKPK